MEECWADKNWAHFYKIRGSKIEAIKKMSTVKVIILLCTRKVFFKKSNIKSNDLENLNLAPFCHLHVPLIKFFSNFPWNLAFSGKIGPNFVYPIFTIHNRSHANAYWGQKPFRSHLFEFFTTIFFMRLPLLKYQINTKENWKA